MYTVICDNPFHKRAANGVEFERDHKVAVAHVDEATARDLLSMSDAYRCPQLTEQDAEDTQQEQTPSTEEVGEQEPESVLDEPLPEDMPGHGALLDAGITTHADLKSFLNEGNDYTSVDGIGPATQDQIDAYWDDPTA